MSQAFRDYLTLVGKESPVEYPICGISGEIKVDGDEITVVFPEEEQQKSRLTLEGKRIHFYEIQDVAKELEPKKLEKYKSYEPYSLPPDVSLKEQESGING